MNNVTGLQESTLTLVRVDDLKVNDEFILEGEVPVYSVVEIVPTTATGLFSFIAHCPFNKRNMTMSFYRGHMVHKVGK